jgi:hypothetical protein
MWARKWTIITWDSRTRLHPLPGWSGNLFDRITGWCGWEAKPAGCGWETTEYTEYTEWVENQPPGLFDGLRVLHHHLTAFIRLTSIPLFLLDAVWLSKIAGYTKAPSTLRFAGALQDDFVGASGWREDAGLPLVNTGRGRRSAPSLPILISWAGRFSNNGRYGWQARGSRLRAGLQR